MNQILICYAFLFFLLITYFFSVLEKITDYQGTKTWMQAHFENTIMGKCLQPCLIVLIFSECITLFLSIYALYRYVTSGDIMPIHYANLANLFCLLIMLIAQRIAKDFDGARTLTIYLTISLLALYIIP